MSGDAGGREAAEAEAYEAFPHPRIELGGATVALIEPHAGHLRAFHRWYERDHMIAAALAAPWMLAARLWVAPRELKALRTPRPGRLAEPVEAGSFLSTFWVQAGHLEDQQQWVKAQYAHIPPERAAFAQRDHVATANYAYRGGAFRDADGVPAELALERGYPGLVASWIERRPDTPLDALAAFLRDDFAPARIARTPVAMSLLLEVLPRPDWWPPGIPDPPGRGERLLVLHFLECDPLECWRDAFADFGPALAASGRAELLLAAPFRAAIPGSERTLAGL